MKPLNGKHLFAFVTLLLSCGAFAKEYTMEDIEKAKTYAAEKNKPLIYVKGHL